MWKNIKNVVSAVSDLVVIGAKEVTYQANRASDATETVTNKIASNTAELRKKYEASLAERKTATTNPEVVNTDSTPAAIIEVN